MESRPVVWSPYSTGRDHRRDLLLSTRPGVIASYVVQMSTFVDLSFVPENADVSLLFAFYEVVKHELLLWDFRPTFAAAEGKRYTQVETALTVHTRFDSKRF